MKNNALIGQRVKLIHMQDPYPVPAGTLGTIEFIDDKDQIHVAWDNGSSLALIPSIDKFCFFDDKIGG